MKQLPTSISYRNSLVAHYADGSAVALSELSADERAAVLHEAVRRYNGGDAAATVIREALAYEREAFADDTEVDGGDLVEFFAGWRERAAEAL